MEPEALDLPEELEEPEVLEEPGVLDDAVPVRLAWPMPNDAPSAPTIPRPASPAWSLLLRWRGVMPRRCGPIR